MSVRGAARPILEKNFMSNAAPDTQLGKIVFVGAGPGNPDLLTVRAREVLANSAIAVTDPQVMQGVRDAVAAALPVPQELLDAAEAEYAQMCADAKAKGARRKPPRPAPPTAAVLYEPGEDIVGQLRECLVEAEGEDVIRWSPATRCTASPSRPRSTPWRLPAWNSR